MTIELAKELIRERLSQKTPVSGWMNDYAETPFFGYSQKCNLLPPSCGEHHQPVYNDMGIRCNSVCLRHFHKNDCLTADNLVAVSVYLVTGEVACCPDEEVQKHIGEIYVCFERPVSRGGDEIYLDDWGGKDLTLDQMGEQYPDLLKELVFNLK